MSEIRATTISDLVGTGPVNLTGQSAAKAWSNLNGTGTIAERDSFNISGYVDNGTGDYTFTISNDMSDANYQPSISGGRDDTRNGHVVPYITPTLAGSLRCSGAIPTTANAHDTEFNYIAIHGDLA